ncbi:PaaI family thioesterase [Blastococcus sp. SYSU DS0616]
MTALHEPPADDTVDNPFRALLGVRVTEVGAGTATVVIDPVAPSLRQARGIVHGGVYATLVDCAAGEALRTVMHPEDGAYTVDLNVTYLRPVVDLALIAHGRTVRRGRTVAVAVVDIQDGAGDLVATGRATFAVRPGERSGPADGGVEAADPREQAHSWGASTAPDVLPASNRK